MENRCTFEYQIEAIKPNQRGATDKRARKMKANLNHVMTVSKKINFQKSVYAMNVGELICEAIRINELINDKAPKFFRSQNNAEFATVYNSVGVMLSTKYEVSKTEGLAAVKTHRQFVFGAEKEIATLGFIKLRVAAMCGFVVFKSGKLGVDANKFFSKIVK